MIRRALVVLAAIALLMSLPMSAAFAASPGRAVLKGSVPAWATARHAVKSADPSTAVGFRVYLGWRNEAAAEALAQAVSDPHSKSYGQYLTPAQFRHEFAPSAAQVNAVRSWLRSQGFSVDYTPANNHYVAAEGTLAQAAAAFNTTFKLYRVQGQVVRSPATALSVPASLGGIVTAVIGLDESDAFLTYDHVVDKSAPPSAGFRNAQPLSDYWAEQFSSYAYPSGFTDLSDPATVPWTVTGYTPDQVKGAYGISNAYDGAGQTVAIIDAFASPTILQDVNQWSTNRGLPTMNRSQLVQIVAPGTYRRPNNPQMGASGWYGEETLDVEAVHGMAPAAKIVFVGAPNNRRDLDAALNHVVDAHLANIVTNSYGFVTELLPRGYVYSVNNTLIQAAIEGIGVYFSSGDEGDDSSVVGFATPSFPPSSPWVTAVGGTSLAIGQDNTRVFETGWGTSKYSCDTTTLDCTRTGWLYGSGGGTSVIFPAPDYQAGLGLTGRAIPDVAALGDPQTGYLVGQTQSFPGGAAYDEYRVGGTSLSSPIFAGLMALAQQDCGCVYGFANPMFYANAGAFTDIMSVKTAVARRDYKNGVDSSAGTVDSLRTFDDYSGSLTQTTRPGWDNVTGLGVPNGIFQLP
jgi:subtilase family serine protease